MRKISKLLIPLLALAPGVMAMTGCGAAEESEFRAYDLEKDGDPTQLRAKVVFWHTMSQLNKELLDRQIQEFNKIFPNITIEHNNQGDYNGVKDKLVKAIPAGTTPTMAFCYPDHVAEYISSGATEEMNQYASDSIIGLGKDDRIEKGGREDFVEKFWAEGEVYASPGAYSLPYAKSTEVLFYNKTEFDKRGYSVPKTWDELWTLCETIKNDIKNDKDYSGLKDFIPCGIDSDSNLFITMCEQKGIPFTSAEEDETKGHYLFNNPQAKAMVADLKDKYDKGYFITEGTSENENYTSNRFIKGLANGGSLMSIGSTGGTSYDWPGKPDESFLVGVAVPPTTDLTKPAVITQGPSITFFKRASLKSKYAAWLFYKWITNAENSAAYALQTGYEPVRQSSYETEAYQTMLNYEYDDKLSLFSSVAKVTKTMQDSYYTSPVFVGSAKAREEVGNIIPAVFFNKSSIDEAFAEALKRCVFATNS